MNIPLIVLFIPYALVILVFIIFSLINIWHLLRYSTNRQLIFYVIYIFIAVVVLNIFITWVNLRGVDWQANIFNSQTIDPEFPFFETL